MHSVFTDKTGDLQCRLDGRRTEEDQTDEE